MTRLRRRMVWWLLRLAVGVSPDKRPDGSYWQDPID